LIAVEVTNKCLFYSPDYIATIYVKTYSNAAVGSKLLGHKK